MIIQTRKSTDPFARVPKALLSDKTLSWRAKGIAAYLLGKPADWIVRTEDIIAQSKEGRDAVRAAFAELRLAGYAWLEEERSTYGTLKGKMWVVSDTPREVTEGLKTRLSVTDGLKNRLPEKPSAGKTPPTKNDSTTKNEKKGAKLSDDAFLADLRKNDGYRGIDIDRELGRMKAWLSTARGARRSLTRQFVVNWLNKIDLPLNGHDKITHPESSRSRGTANEGVASQYAGIGKLRPKLPDPQ